MLSEVKVEVGSQRSLKAYVGHQYDAQRVISKENIGGCYLYLHVGHP